MYPVFAVAIPTQAYTPKGLNKRLAVNGKKDRKINVNVAMVHTLSLHPPVKLSALPECLAVGAFAHYS